MDFDVVFGVDATSLSVGIDELNNEDNAHDTFFKGAFGSGDPSGTWEIPRDRSPVFEFQAPTADKWHAAVDGTGAHPDGDPPVDNVVILSLPEVDLLINDGGAQSKLSPGFEFYAQLALADSTASLTPLAIWVDPATVSTVEKAIFDAMILPAVFNQLGPVLTGHTIAPQQITVGDTAIELATTDGLITGTHLVVVAKADTGTAQAVPETWPDQPVFAIINHAFAQYLAQTTADAHQNVTVYDKTGSGGGASFSAKAVLDSVNDISIDESDATSWSASLDVSFDASASVLGTKCALKKSSDSL